MDDRMETTQPTDDDRQNAAGYLPSHPHLVGIVAQAIADARVAERERVLLYADTYAAGSLRRIGPLLADELKTFRKVLDGIDEPQKGTK